MTSTKSVSWSALVNVGNNESLALTVSGEAATPGEARFSDRQMGCIAVCPMVMSR